MHGGVGRGESEAYVRICGEECVSVGNGRRCMCEGVCMVNMWGGGKEAYMRMCVGGEGCKSVGSGRRCMCEGVCMLTGSRRPLLGRTPSQE